MIGGQEMPKRFHDTDIWNEDWFLDMDEEYRMFWFYLKDTCDHAGIWKPNVRRFNSEVGKKINLDKALELFNAEKKRIERLDSGHWVLLDFINFQYGSVLNLKNSCHLSVFNRLNKLEVSLGSLRGLIEVKEGSSRPQVEVKAGVKDKDKDIVIVISKRLKAFKVLVDSYNNKYPQEMLDEFYNHFSELNKTKTKMLCETFKTWELKNRLVKWASNDYSGVLKGEKNGFFKIDSTGFPMAYCEKCGVSASYRNEELKGDSKCCSAKLLAEKPAVDKIYQSGEMY